MKKVILQQAVSVDGDPLYQFTTKAGTRGEDRYTYEVMRPARLVFVLGFILGYTFVWFLDFQFQSWQSHLMVGFFFASSLSLLSFVLLNSMYDNRSWVTTEKPVMEKIEVDDEPFTPRSRYETEGGERKTWTNFLLSQIKMRYLAGAVVVGSPMTRSQFRVANDRYLKDFNTYMVTDLEGRWKAIRDDLVKEMMLDDEFVPTQLLLDFLPRPRYD